uniref:(northern house mosquito) hypothetical protein n=1 Tax=Culex pipiens TaxID=7175 RepID=A0A8D7ZUU0_CULPI
MLPVTRAKIEKHSDERKIDEFSISLPPRKPPVVCQRSNFPTSAMGEERLCKQTKLTTNKKVPTVCLESVSPGAILPPSIRITANNNNHCAPPPPCAKQIESF